MIKRIQEDIAAYRLRDPAAKGPASIFFTYPGFHAVMWYRIANVFWRGGFSFLARLVSNTGRLLTGIEIHPGARIGRRFVIDHGSGVVIGETAEIGDDVTLYHQVTLGGVAPSVDSESQRGQKRHPTLEDGVIVGCGAAVLGPIHVGRGARVGANAVVTKDVPASVTAVGNPAQIVMPKNKEKAAEFQAYGTPTDGQDPVMQTITNLHTQVRTLMARIEELEKSQPDTNMSDRDDDEGKHIALPPGGKKDTA